MKLGSFIEYIGPNRVTYPAIVTNVHEIREYNGDEEKIYNHVNLVYVNGVNSVMTESSVAESPGFGEKGYKEVRI